MDMDVQRFRQRCVEPMGEESDHLHIVALTDALQARLGPLWSSVLTLSSHLQSSTVCMLVPSCSCCSCLRGQILCSSLGCAGYIINASQVPIRVMYLDQSTAAAMAGVAVGDAAVNHHDFIPEGTSAGCRPIPRVHVLYRPGHYDILYPRVDLNLS